MLGNGRLEAELFDDKSTKMLAHIRGKMRKKVRLLLISHLLILLIRLDSCFSNY